VRIFPINTITVHFHSVLFVQFYFKASSLFFGKRQKSRYLDRSIGNGSFDAYGSFLASNAYAFGG
jgi:hypothetical protein